MRKTSRLRFTCATAFPLRLLLQLPAAIGASSTLWSQGWRWPVKASWAIYAIPYTSSIDSGFFYFCNCFGLWEIKARQNFNNHEKLHHRSSEFTKFESMSGPPVNLQIAVRGPTAAASGTLAPFAPTFPNTVRRTLGYVAVNGLLGTLAALPALLFR